MRFRRHFTIAIVLPRRSCCEESLECRRTGARNRPKCYPKFRDRRHQAAYSAEPYLRVFMGVVAWVERLNLKYSKVGNPPIYDKAVFPWIREIEREWRLVRGELDRVLTRKDDLPGFHELATDIATISQDHGWKSFMLCGYGFRSDRNIERCPKTWSICQKIPGLITVMYFEPGRIAGP